MSVSRIDEEKDCEGEQHMTTWLIVYSGIYFIMGLKDIAIFFVSRSRNFKTINSLLELLYYCLVFNFQVAWLIYGNTFHYKQETLNCKNKFYSINQLWVLEMIIIALGYIQFLVFSFICCAISCLCCIIIANGGVGEKQEKFVSQFEVTKAISNLNKKAFRNVKEKLPEGMKECAICLMEY